jgi:hypothetical protein
VIDFFHRTKVTKRYLNLNSFRGVPVLFMNEKTQHTTHQIKETSFRKWLEFDFFWILFMNIIVYENFSSFLLGFSK